MYIHVMLGVRDLFGLCTFSESSVSTHKCVVWQVVMMTGGEVQCPISLETDPLCPQITPCGHVFAFHSIMQHLMTQASLTAGTPVSARRA